MIIHSVGICDTFILLDIVWRNRIREAFSLGIRFYPRPLITGDVVVSGTAYNMCTIHSLSHREEMNLTYVMLKINGAVIISPSTTSLPLYPIAVSQLSLITIKYVIYSYIFG